MKEDNIFLELVSVEHTKVLYRGKIGNGKEFTATFGTTEEQRLLGFRSGAPFGALKKIYGEPEIMFLKEGENGKKQ